MRVLVIGGTALTGPHIARALERRGHEVAVCHRGQHEAELPHAVRHIHGDWRTLATQLRAWAPDVVLHMWVLTEADADALVDTFRGAARRLVVISSGDVYRAYGILRGTEEGPPEPVPLSEEAALRRVLYPYRAADQAPDDWMAAYEKILVERRMLSEPTLPATVLRYPAVYGPGDPAHRLAPWLRQIEAAGDSVAIGERFGAWRWTHGYSEDVAAAAVLAVTNETAAGRVYNVGEALTPTMAQRLEQFGRAGGWNGRLIAAADASLPDFRKDLNYSQDLIMDSTRIRTELGYAETVPVDEGLRRTIAFERAFSKALEWGAA